MQGRCLGMLAKFSESWLHLHFEGVLVTVLTSLMQG